MTTPRENRTQWQIYYVDQKTLKQLTGKGGGRIPCGMIGKGINVKKLGTASNKLRREQRSGKEKS